MTCQQITQHFGIHFCYIVSVQVPILGTVDEWRWKYSGPLLTMQKFFMVSINSAFKIQTLYRSMISKLSFNCRESVCLRKMG